LLYLETADAMIDRSSMQDRGRVIPLRPRAHSARSRWQISKTHPTALSQNNDLARYERAAEPDDYRHRMIMNVAGLLVTVALIVTGLWLADSLADLRREQDCVMSGRINCAQLHIEPLIR
jgi:hypothetical protein